MREEERIFKLFALLLFEFMLGIIGFTDIVPTKFLNLLHNKKNNTPHLIANFLGNVSKLLHCTLIFKV